jgi:hypothetical protein
MNPKPTKPYDLEVINNSSEFFYKKLSDFTDQYSLIVHNQYGSLINNYSLFNKLHPNDALLDILITGVLYNTHGYRRHESLHLKSNILSFLYKLRKVNSSVKKTTDNLRGKLAFKWLSDPQTMVKVHTLGSFYSLLDFLTGTCEYTEEILRIKEVLKFIKSQNQNTQTKMIREITELAEIFENNSSITFAPFTKNVENIWETNKHEYKYKENYFFASRKPVEYHLNMVGAELMNRTLNPMFKTTQKQVILVPTCMSKQLNCRKKVVNGEITCTQCSADCNVNQISQRFNTKSTRTVLIPHSSKFSKYLKPWANQNDTGLIGVACVLNLLKGGFEMKRLNIPAQCIFLNYAGCAKHWKSGVPTSMNIKQLQAIIGKDNTNVTQLKIA